MMGTTETGRVRGRYHHFCFSVKGHVKLLRLGVTVTSMAFFIIAQAPEPYIVVTGFEVTIVSFFIILYIFRLDQLMNWLFWPLLDIINSLVTTLFMVIISVMALLPETTTFTILGGGEEKGKAPRRGTSNGQRCQRPRRISVVRTQEEMD